MVLKSRETVKSNEGVTKEQFSDTPFIFEGILYESQREYSREMYSMKEKGMLTILMDLEQIEMKMGDGVCIEVNATEKPDYRIKQILKYTMHMKVVVEKL